MTIKIPKRTPAKPITGIHRLRIHSLQRRRLMTISFGFVICLRGFSLHRLIQGGSTVYVARAKRSIKQVHVY